jgi:3-dehydroquinate synthetase
MDIAGADAEFVKRQDRLLDLLGLAPLEVTLPVESLFEAMHADKKARGGVVRMVLAQRPGVWSCIAVEDSVVRAHLDAWAATKERGGR